MAFSGSFAWSAAAKTLLRSARRGLANPYAAITKLSGTVRPRMAPIFTISSATVGIFAASEYMMASNASNNKMLPSTTGDSIRAYLGEKAPRQNVIIQGKPFKVTAEKSADNLYVTIVDLFGEKAFDPCVPFCNACITKDGHIFVSGTIGIHPGTATLVEGGIGAETTAIMVLIEAALKSCGASMDDLTNVNVFLKDNNGPRFREMNRAYIKYFKGTPLPARITVGCGNLALGANVEIQATAYRKSS
eukprot:jgi/Bigna1/146243/aug1.111_g20951